MAEEAAMMAEFESGLANFSLSVSGAAAGGVFAHAHLHVNIYMYIVCMHVFMNA
jgi:hypothetical protein